MEMACCNQSQSLANINVHENAQTQNRKTTLISALSEAPTRMDARKSQNPHRKKVEHENWKQKCKWHAIADHIPSLPFPHEKLRKCNNDKRHLFQIAFGATTQFSARKVQKPYRKKSRKQKLKTERRMAYLFRSQPVHTVTKHENAETENPK